MRKGHDMASQLAERFGQVLGRAELLIGRFRGRSATTDAPSAEIDPNELTSPHTVSDPVLEQRRAVEAAARERESRESSVTKFEELRQQEEAERSEHSHAPTLAEPPAPRS